MANIDDIVIRKFTQADKGLVTAFFNQMNGETRALFNQNDCNSIRAMKFFDENKIDSEDFLAEYENEMAGYVFFMEFDTCIPWLGIAVSEKMKGKGLGKKLLRFAEHYAKEHKKGGILLITHMANYRAQALYTRAGYEYLGVHTSGQLLYLLRFSE